MTHASLERKLRIGISACVLGEEVRHDGSHKRDRLVLKLLQDVAEWTPVCPEVEVGMGTPRPSLRLVGQPENPRMIAPKTGQDHTEAMQAWSVRRIEELRARDLDGFVLKKNSPSCGLLRVRVYNDHGIPSREGSGLFARRLTQELPLLPVEEDGRLHDPRLRENFVERVFAYARWKQIVRDDPTPANLIRFHASQKLTLMAHSVEGARELGRIVAGVDTRNVGERIDAYGRAFLRVMSIVATTRRHTNVLQHLMGYLKNQLQAEHKQELLEVIEDFRLGLAPLVAPLTLLNHHLRNHPVPAWVRQQTYLDPYPKEMVLRSSI